MTLPTKAIEAGARAEQSVNDEMNRIRALFGIRPFWAEEGDREDLISYAKEIVRLKAAIASGELVPAGDVAAERERCAKVAESTALGSGAKIIAAAIRALSTEPASGEFVVVPRSDLARVVEIAWRSEAAPEIERVRAMLNSATKDGERK